MKYPSTLFLPRYILGGDAYMAAVLFVTRLHLYFSAFEWCASLSCHDRGNFANKRPLLARAGRGTAVERKMDVLNCESSVQNDFFPRRAYPDLL